MPVTPVAIPGTPVGVTAIEDPDAMLVPAELVAVAVKVYAEPLVNAVTTHVKVEVVEQYLLVSCTAVTL